MRILIIKSNDSSFKKGATPTLEEFLSSTEYILREHGEPAIAKALHKS